MSKIRTYIGSYLSGIHSVIDKLDRNEIAKTIEELVKLKKRKGRLFLLGVGGSAASCSHAVNDFRKICHIEAYTPTDNVAELTARTNDDGWDSVFVNYLRDCHLTKKDTVMVFSVGGGSQRKNISVNIVLALLFAKKKGTTILGIVGRDGGVTRKVADTSILISSISDETVTPYAETFQAVLWHLIVNFPFLKTKSSAG